VAPKAARDPQTLADSFAVRQEVTKNYARRAIGYAADMPTPRGSTSLAGWA
jgi:hypothetical protein